MEILLPLLKIVAALLLVLMNGLFVAAEFAFVKVRPTRIAQLVKEGNKKALSAQGCVENIDAYLSVTQLGITLASLGLGWLGEPAVAALLTPLLFKWGVDSAALVHSISFIVAFSLITFLHVVFGELAPKSIAIHKAESLSLWLAGPMHFFYFIFYPAVILLNGVANKFVVVLGIEPAHESEITHSEEELRMIIAESYRSGHIKQSEQYLLQNVFRFEKLVAEDIMIPRPDVVFLDTSLSVQDNFEIARRYGYTRFPLCNDSPDNVIGLIHIKDLMLNEKFINNIADFKRDIIFIPEGMPLDHILPLFQRKHQHMAVVLDEYGGTAGIVTMENVLEELVGEIQDEFDNEEPQIIFEDDGSLLVDGRMLLDDAVQYFNLKLDDDKDQYTTLAGFILGKLGKIPAVGDIVKLEKHHFEVSRMSGMRIERLRVKKAGKAGDGS